MALSWTKQQLCSTDADWLRNRPLIAQCAKAGVDVCLVHAHPDDKIHTYITDAWDAESAFEAHAAQLIFIGHTHQPAVWTCDADGSLGRYRRHNNNRYPIIVGQRLLVNVGSVGHPRDNDPRASYVVWDTNNYTFQFHRVAYDIERTQQAILAAELPSLLAERLAIGR